MLCWRWRKRHCAVGAIAVGAVMNESTKKTPEQRLWRFVLLRDLFQCFVWLLRPRLFSHFDTATVATPLPMKLVNARTSLMKRSIPKISAIPATGMSGTTIKVPASDKARTGHAGRAFEVNIATAKIVSCCHRVRSIFKACAMNNTAKVM